jgi:hypothetical protein
MKNLPIILSFFSILISGLALGWNIFRDVILKPRLKVRFSISKLAMQGVDEHPTFLRLSATNWGPGAIICNMIVYKYRPWFGFLKWNKEQGVVLYDYSNRLNEKLPKKMEVGDSMDQLLKYEANSVLSQKITHIGFVNSFGRQHFSPRKDVKEALNKFKKDFNASKIKTKMI